MKYASLLVEDAGPVRLVTINRPQVLNALNNAVLTELRAVVAEAAAEPAIRSLVLIGAGEKAFVAGADLAEMAGMSPSDGEALSMFVKDLVNDIRACPKPVIAAINGYCFGGGLELALACDVRMASGNASFALPELKLGLLPGGGGIIHLGRIIGNGPARALVLTCESISADRAHALGLVTHLTSPAELKTSAIDLATRMGGLGAAAFAQAKQVLNVAGDTPLQAAGMLEAKAFAMCLASPEAHQRIGAFLNRKPAS